MSTTRTKIINRLADILKPEYEISFEFFARPVRADSATVIIIPRSERAETVFGNPPISSKRDITILVVCLQSTKTPTTHMDSADQIEALISKDEELTQMSSMLKLDSISFERFDEAGLPVFVTGMEFSFKYTVVYGD